MADREYIIDIILRARDDMGRAFAEATGQMEAYNKLLDEQKAKNEASRVAQQKYSKELDNRTTSEERLNKALAESKLRNTDAVAALARYEQAQRRVNQAEAEGNSNARILALKQSVQAHKDLINELAKEENSNRGLATIQANRLTHEASLQARLRQTAQIEEQESKKRITAEREIQREAVKTAREREQSEREWQRAADAINRETERARTESMRRLAQQDTQETRERQSRRRAEQRENEQLARAESQRQHQITQVIGGTARPANVLARTDISQTQEIRATRELSAAKARLIQLGVSEAEAGSRIHAVRQQALSDYGHSNQAARDAARFAKDEAEAYRMVETDAKKLEQTRKGLSSRRVVPTGQGGFRNTSGGNANVPSGVNSNVFNRGTTNTGGGGSGGGGGGFWSGFTSGANQAAEGVNKVSGALSGGLTPATALIQPLAALILGLVAAFASLYSAVIAAATAIGTIFASAIAQGVPVVGLLAAAMQRFSSIIQLVQGQQAQLQQRFIAQYETAAQNAMGINQVAIAQHNYSDALFQSQVALRNVTVAEHSYSDAAYAQRQAVFQVGIAQLALSAARRDATRQLQQLIFQETNARLAAEASSLAITHSQKALRAAIATGGDVQQAQLDLSSAHAQHAQAVAGAHNAIADAAQGSVTRRQIQDTVIEAQRGVEQAKRAVVDANFSLAQAAQGIVQARRAVVDSQFQVAAARAAIIQAQQAAAGYNVATAAQLAWLRSQMTKTELSLARNIQNIYKLFQGAHGYLRPVTDAILGAFIPLSQKIYQTLLDPRIFQALLQLGQSIGGAIRKITNTVFSPQSINNFIAIIHAAAQNLGPLASIISNVFRGMQSVIVVAIPFVHQFLLVVDSVARRFADWATSTKGKNWLADWFKIAFASLQGFMSLGFAVIRLIAAVVGVGGGAKSGISILQLLTNWVNRTTDSINSHGRVFRDLQKLWSMAIPTLHALGMIIGAVARGFLQLGSSRNGKAGLQALADIVAHVLVPAFIKFSEIMGGVFVKVSHFLTQHPALKSFLVDFLAFAGVASVAMKTLSIFLGPIGKILGLIGRLGSAISALGGFSTIGDVLIAIFTGPAAAIAAIVGGIVLLAKWTGTLGQLWNAVKAPFVAIWNQIRKPIQDLIKDFQYMVGSFGHLSGAFNVLKNIIGRGLSSVFTLMKGVLGTLGNILGRAFGDMIKVIGGVFRLIGDVLRGHWGAVFKDAVRIGKAMLDGIWNAITALPRLIVSIFVSMIRAIEKWLGISSPSRKMHSIGQAMVQGIFNALKSLVELGGKIISWIANGIGKLLGWVIGLGEKILKGIWNGIVGAFKKYWDFEKWLWSHIFNAIWGILKDVEHLGEKIIDAIIKGIKKAPGKLLNAIKGLIPQPLKDAGSAVGNFIGGLNPFATGGPVPGGYGGGDIIGARLEPGEHVWTKEEVRAVGGHDAMFAMRRSVGGGGQGGPSGYAQGGAVIQPRTTQGVTGHLGGELANVRLFAQMFQRDWHDMWNNVNNLTRDNFNWEVKQFDNYFGQIQDKWKGFNDTITGRLKKWWNDTNQNAQDGLNKLLFNFDWTYNKVDTDSFNAFWYIMHIAQQSLSAFGQKFNPPSLMKQPKMTKVAEGGWIGNMGERGSDAVHAVLGRGEAVLNWAHQRLVDPALRAYYGFGLDRFFDKVRGQHAGDDAGYAGMAARPNKFAAGGMAFPFPKNQPFSWQRIDQGQDLETNPGGVVVAIAPGIVSRASDRFGGFGPFYATEQITDGPLRGRGVYYGHTKVVKTGPVNTGDVIAVTQQRANTWTAAPAGWLELGFLPYGSMTAGNAIAPILHQLAAGHRVTGVGGLGGLGGAVWNNIAKQAVRGSGVLAQLMKAGIGKVTDAANAYGQKAAGSAGGTGGAIGTNWKGPWTQVMAQIANKMHWNLGDWKWLVNAESSGNPEIVNPSSGAFGLGQFLGATLRAYAKYGAASHDPVKQIQAMGQYILDRYHNPTVAKAFHLAHNSYAKGGFVGNARQITAHVGEWVLNEKHQEKLGRLIGAAPDKIRDFLGLTGGKTHFKDGGVVGLMPTVTKTGGINDPANVEANEGFGFGLGAIGVVNRAEQVTSRMISNLRRRGKSISDKLGQYLDNLNQLTGDGGILTLAAQALDDYIGRQTTIVSLAANGIRQVTRRIREGRKWITITTNKLSYHNQAQTALEAAQTDLRNTQQIGDDLRRLQATEVTAIQGVQSQLNHFGRVTKANLAQYQRLIGQRKTLLTQISDTDSKIAQNAQDIIDKQQSSFQARLDQELRSGGTFDHPGNVTLNAKDVGAITLGIRPGSGTGGLGASFANLQGVLSKVGPSIALGLAQMSQTIAQTLGDPDKLRISDQAIVDASERQREAIQNAYNRAAQKAQGDPRWQKIADDLLGQLENATTSVVQAQAQALTDAIQTEDTAAQRQVTALQIQDRLAAVRQAMGDQFGAIASQIGTSQLRSTTLQGQIGTYQGLLYTATAQGNIQAQHDLQDKIADLTAQVAEANLQTQQLITAYRQAAVTILQTQTQASSGFFSAANTIAQTLGQITGSQNLPALISYARQAASTLIDEGRRAVQNITDTINDPNGPFGSNGGQAGQFLNSLVAAFQEGPQVFANAIANLGPQMGQFESGLPQDQQQLFQQLVQGLIDNTTAQVQNTQQLQQLNATTNQQQFQSSAWTMFRQAIFSGLGTLLPQYAMQVPAMDTGGMITKSGLFYGHRDELITPAGVSRGNFGGDTHINAHTYITSPTEVADPNYLSNQIAWRIGQDPNSR